MLDEELGPKVDATVVDSVRINPDGNEEIREITLQVDEPSFRYREGQSIGIAVPGPHPFGNKYHLRRYSIAHDLGEDDSGAVKFTILVRRCFYIDDVSGESYPGIASNYLCDATAGQQMIMTGPYHSPFKMPPETSDNIVMISSGTGIAPFRAFIQNIYREKGAWRGKVRLFYGSKTGMDLIYMNDVKNDIGMYYDEKTFQAYNALVDHPLSTETDALQQSIDANAQQIWDLVHQPNTYFYLGGLKAVSDVFDKKMSELAGSKEKWAAFKKDLSSQGRFSELLYN